MAEEKTLDDLFLDTLKDIYFAERQIVKALPKMAKAAQSADLKAGFEKHRDETEDADCDQEGEVDVVELDDVNESTPGQRVLLELPPSQCELARPLIVGVGRGIATEEATQRAGVVGRLDA